MQIPGSIKHVQIDKARSRANVVVAVATAVTIFSLVSVKSLIAQGTYQKRVIHAKQATDKQLQANVTASQSLVTQYNQVFEGSDPTNLIGGKNDKSPNATPPNGDNARIILDALPSKYDFPALITSVAQLLAQDGVKNASIGGSDASDTVSNLPIVTPVPVPIALTISGTTTYPNIQRVIKDFERSIRPFDITSLNVSGSEKTMSFTLIVTSYYQQPKSLELTTEEIK